MSCDWSYSQENLMCILPCQKSMHWRWVIMFKTKLMLHMVNFVHPTAMWNDFPEKIAYLHESVWVLINSIIIYAFNSSSIKVVSYDKLFFTLTFNPLSSNSDQQQFSPNHILTLSRDKVMRINKIITKEKMPWSFIKFSQLLIKRNVWRPVWRICMWILGLKG